ncbi:MAG TPA: Do family serine endopeptidase [Thermoanaerobaculaceae bacterium]|nr:Do family serine endopeptidase [Thermoanaerobaculaceae bacterium]
MRFHGAGRATAARAAGAIGLTAVIGLLTLLAVGRSPGLGVASAQDPALSSDEVSALEAQNRAFEHIAAAVTPAIVNIQTTQVIKVQQSPFSQDPFFHQFFGEMFGPYNVPREQREHALGSGVIVTPDGTIVTNNHVVAKATEIQVMLSDKRVFKARVVGTDPDTDVAVIKIDATGLPTVTWGDSSTLRVGDLVMAFGNPFGLNFTVTRGIVSAVGRAGLGIESFEDFIQTDAAINPGNSGGALVDVRARLVGISTAIVTGGSGMSGEGGSNGIGLAIPANIVRHAMESLIKTGKVERGYLGVSVGDLTEKLAKQFGAPDIAGAVVEDVTAGSPADKAGVKAGDVVRAVDGEKVTSKDQLTSRVASTDPGTTIRLGLIRNGREETVAVTLGTRPASMGVVSGRAAAPQSSTLQGVTVQNLTPKLRQQLGLDDAAQGVVISQLDPSCAAAQGGLQTGDVIQEIDRHPVRNAADFERLAAGVKGEVLLRIVRQGSGAFFVISPAQ